MIAAPLECKVTVRHATDFTVVAPSLDAQLERCDGRADAWLAAAPLRQGSEPIDRLCRASDFSLHEPSLDAFLDRCDGRADALLAAARLSKTPERIVELYHASDFDLAAPITDIAASTTSSESKASTKCAKRHERNIKKRQAEEAKKARRMEISKYKKPKSRNKMFCDVPSHKKQNKGALKCASMAINSLLCDPLDEENVFAYAHYRALCWSEGKEGGSWKAKDFTKPQMQECTWDFILEYLRCALNVTSTLLVEKFSERHINVIRTMSPEKPMLALLHFPSKGRLPAYYHVVAIKNQIVYDCDIDTTMELKEYKFVPNIQKLYGLCYNEP
jgi:hypothetical protein